MAERKQQILDAALQAFTEKGFAAATVADVRALSGASTGSIYHHFGDKEGLAAALFVAAIRDYQAGFLAVLEAERDAERGVKALVRHHLRWVAAHPDLARFLLAGPPSGATEAVGRLNRDTFVATRRWLEQRRLASVPFELFYVLVIGPAHEFCRHWLEGRMKTSMASAERVLAEAAWRGLGIEGGNPGG